VVLKVMAGVLIPFAYRTITFYGCPFQRPLARDKICNSVPVLDQAATPYNPLKA
jgi:hypothetical protein